MSSSTVSPAEVGDDTKAGQRRRPRYQAVCAARQHGAADRSRHRPASERDESDDHGLSGPFHHYDMQETLKLL
jgi:hypothetical protein